jgi:tRNA pseudouridine55 synthase
VLGVLVVDKPLGLTSHDAVNAVRRKLGTRRVGHAGSLDPIGTGVLVVAVGPATRFLQYLPLEPKEYDALFRFGVETDTQDAEGEVVSEQAAPDDLGARIEQVLPRFLGAIDQVPPMYSAVKKDGRALYKYAREGIEVDRQPREVYIHAFEPVQIGQAEARFRIVCSGGTYVRTLAHDLGGAVGCGAHVAELRRTAVGKFGLDAATPLEQVAATDLLDLRQALSPMPTVQLPAPSVTMVREGRAIPAAPGSQGELVALLDESGRAFSVARRWGPKLQPECVIPAEAMGDPI